MPSIINAATSGGLISTADTSGVLQLQTASTTALTITAGQLVGIGTASPTVQLLNIAGTSVSGPTNNPVGVQFTDNGFSLSSQIVNRAGNTLYNVPSTKSHSFQVNSTEAVAMYANGIGLGGAIPSSGTGITFPATQSASSDANTLDDYEEGTWTPTDASGAGLSFTVIGTARYVKIGRLVFFSIDQLNYPSTSNTSSASIGGLPFTNNANNTGGINPVANNSNIDAGLVVANATNMFFYPAAVLTAATNANLSGANIYGISGCYQVP